MTTQEKRSRKMADAQTLTMCTALQLIDGQLVAGEGFVRARSSTRPPVKFSRTSPRPAPSRSSGDPAAQQAFGQWSRTTPQQRSNLCCDIANAIENTPIASPVSNP